MINKKIIIRPEEHKDYKKIVSLILRSFQEGTDYSDGTAMLMMGIEKVRELGYKGINVEGNYNFYNQVGFRTSSEYNIFPTSGYPMKEPRCMMCQETYEGSLDGIHGYIVYDMYFNA